MAHSVKISGAAFTKFVSQIAPYLELASAFYLFGSDQTESLKNHADTDLPATVVGTPTYGTGFATLSQANGFDSGILGGSPFTHIIVASQPTANIGLCGNWKSGAANNLIMGYGTALCVDGNTRVNQVFNIAGYSMLSGSHNGTTAELGWSTGGAMNYKSGAYATGANLQTAFRVGAHGYSSGTFNAAAALTFNSALTQAQVNEIYVWLKALLAGRGITVA